MAGDVALLSNRWHMTLGPSDGERAGLEGTSTEVARRQPDGSWRYVIDDPASTTVLPGAQTPTVGDPSTFEQLLYEEDDSGSSVRCEQWRGCTTEKCLRSSVATLVSPKRSHTATVDASTNPRSRSL